MKKTKSMKNFFGRFEIGLYASVAAMIYGAFAWFAGFSYFMIATGPIFILLGIIGFIVFDSLRIKTDELDRYLNGRIERARGVGLFEPENVFRTFAVIGAEKRKMGSDGKLRTEICHETALRLDSKQLRIESCCVHLLTEETECFAADFPMPGVTVKQENEDFNDGKRIWRQTYLTLTAADGRSYRFPVPTNSSDVDQFIDRINRHNRA